MFVPVINEERDGVKITKMHTQGSGDTKTHNPGLEDCLMLWFR